MTADRISVGWTPYRRFKVVSKAEMAGGVTRGRG